MTALFLPLKREWYEAFLSGEKTEEFRPNISRWSAKICRIGRPVILSLGYGKSSRALGVISGWRECGPDAHPAIRTVYPEGDSFVAIRIDGVKAERLG
jgi:hypothetical protein